MSGFHILERIKQTPSPERISGGDICLTKKIINTDIIEMCKWNKQFGSQLLGTGFHIAVFALGDANLVGHHLLGEIMIFTQVF